MIGINAKRRNLTILKGEKILFSINLHGMNSFKHNEDNYHPEDQYREHLPAQDGFARFQDPENGQWYFAYYHNDELILRSEGYSAQAGRDSGLESVKIHMADDSNYVTKMLPDGKWVLELRSGNNKEIARTPRFDEEHLAKMLLPSSIAARDTIHDTSEEKLRRKDDYLACKEYEYKERYIEHPQFTVFEHEREYYFALVDEEDEVLLRGEGYRTEAGRKNGMESVIRNKDNKDRYIIEENLGYHFVVLRSGNNQEIARSCPKSEEGAAALIALLTGTPAGGSAATGNTGGSNWWIWLLLILAVVILYFLLNR